MLTENKIDLNTPEDEEQDQEPINGTGDDEQEIQDVAEALNNINNTIDDSPEEMSDKGKQTWKHLIAVSPSYLNKDSFY